MSVSFFFRRYQLHCFSYTDMNRKIKWLFLCHYRFGVFMSPICSIAYLSWRRNSSWLVRRLETFSQYAMWTKWYIWNESDVELWIWNQAKLWSLHLWMQLWRRSGIQHGFNPWPRNASSLFYYGNWAYTISLINSSALGHVWTHNCPALTIN